MPSLRIVVLNASTHAAAFDALAAASAGAVEIVHTQYRSSWEEVSARRTGAPLVEPEDIPAVLADSLAGADVLFGFTPPRAVLHLAPRLRWVHTPATGIDHLRGTGILESSILLTTAGGLFAPVIAEHVVLSMLYFAKLLPEFRAQTAAKVWRMQRIGTLAGATVGLVGIGNIGRAVARLAAAFGMHVIGVGRGESPRTLDGTIRVLPRSQLPHLLSASAYVVLAVADTPATLRLIGAAELAAMPAHSVLINVARGTIVDEPALVEALRAGRLRGAALDVFAHEPLPANSPLWEMPNVLLTPHVAANATDYLPKAIDQFGDNVRRYLRGEPLLNLFDRTRGY